MRIVESGIPEVKLVVPERYRDERGWFSEVFNSSTFTSIGLPSAFLQDNQSFSTRNVLRGLHYQVARPQGKLVRVISGHIWDVAVDLRRNSPTFGQHAGFHLRPQTEAGDLEMLWIPEGFAHGFVVLSEFAEVLYKTTDFYHPSGERCIRWDDPVLAIDWPISGITPVVSAKDAQGSNFDSAELP